MKLEHLAMPRNQSMIHIKHPYKDYSLCGQLHMYTEKHGTMMQVGFVTPQPANCKACGKGLEMLCREQLTKLTPKGFEKILETITSMQNGELRPDAKG